MYKNRFNQNLFKGFLHPSHAICSEKYIKAETQFLIDMFVQNEHKRTFLKNLVKNYYHAKKKNNDSRNYTNSKKISWVLNIGPKIMKEFKKVNKDVTFTSRINLRSTLCQNKPYSHPGVYQLDCSCDGRYIGKSKKNVLARRIEHQKDSIKDNWELFTPKDVKDNST